MDFSKLEKNIFDVLKEEQVKLGYQKEKIRLYYPLASLNRTLGTDFNIEGMAKCLEEFAVFEEEKFGRAEISNKKDRFCIGLAPRASEYVYENSPQEGFLYDFIGTVAKHGAGMEEVIAQFKKYSDCVHVEKMDDEEFDYLVYFEDGEPDDYMYCLTDEGCHVIYHRFSIDDYNDAFNQESQ